MKKFLSIFIALAMVFSLFAGVGAHSAKAADSGMHITSPVALSTVTTNSFIVSGTFDAAQTNSFQLAVTVGALGTYTYYFNATAATTWSVAVSMANFPGMVAGTAYTTTLQAGTVAPAIPPLQTDPTTITWTPATPVLTGTATISGLNTADSVTKLPTYTFITNPTVQAAVTFSSALDFFNLPTFTVTDVNGTTVAGAKGTFLPTGTNSMMLSLVLASPISVEGIYNINIYDHTGATLLGTAPIYVKYLVTVTVATPAPAYNQWSFISGTVYNAEYGSPTYLYLVNGTSSTVATVTNGIFTLSSNFPNRGTYTLQGLLNTGSTTYPNPAVYKSWALSGNLVVKNVLDPNPIYSAGYGVPATETSYLYIGYDDGSPATGATVTYASGVAPTWAAFTEIGAGFYSITGTTPTYAGVNTYTVKVSGYSVSYQLMFNAPSTTWNPTVTLGIPATGNAVGSEWTINVAYGVSSSYILHDQVTSSSGPLGSDTFASLMNDYAADESGVASLDSIIATGGQMGLTLSADLWPATTLVNGVATTTTALLANPVTVEQTFNINPAVVGDVVTTDYGTTLAVGSAATITVTVKKASGVERNNGVVQLVGTTAGMFTAPYGAVYSVSPDGMTVTLDAKVYNTNIVGGVYAFTGLIVNHSGYISVMVYDGDPTVGTYGSLTCELDYDGYVAPATTTLTSSVAKFVAGQVYPVVTISGGVSGLSFKEFDPYIGYYGAYTTTPTYGGLSYVDNGDGTYTFTWPAGIPNWGTIKLRGTVAGNSDIRYAISIPVVKPTITITSVHTDGLITAGVPEAVTFTVTDPITGAAMLPTTGKFVEQYTTWTPGYGNYDLQVSSVTNGVTVLGAANSITATAVKGNTNVDYTATKPNIKLYLKFNNEAFSITYSNFLTVTAAKITVTPSDLVLHYGQANQFSVNALDAHGAALEGVNVYGTNPYQAYSPFMFGGITGANGTVAFTYTPTYMGEIYIESSTLGLTKALGTELDVQITAAPADTTAPVITIATGIDGSTVASDALTLTGTVTDNVGVTQVYVGMNKVDLLPDGSFQAMVKLAAGANTITVSAYDAAGNKGTASVKVTFTPAAAKTVIMLTIGTDVVTVNGKATSIDAVPEIVNGRTFVPIRFIAETFGATVDWLAETQGITVTLGDSTIGLQIGNATAVINGSIMSLEAAPYIKNGRTMVPLRVISEAFGGNVAWDPALRTITITY